MVSTQAAGAAKSADAAPAKFSLSLGSKFNRVKHQIHDKQDSVKQQYVASFDPDQAPSAARQRIIAKQADTFQGPGKAKPQRFLPTPGEALVDTSERFETAAPEEADTSITYGLTLQTSTGTVIETATTTSVTEAADPAHAPPLLTAEQELDRYQQQLHAAAEEATLDDYTNTPIEEFGAALLRGMGWAEGKAVGRRNIRGVVPQAIQFVARPSGLGLGADPAPTAPKREKKYVKPGESRQQKPDLVALDANGNIKNVRGLDDKLVERSSLGPKPGKTMRIAEGRHSGLSCIVLALEPHIEGRSDKATVRLLPSETTATVRCKELAERGTATQAPATAKGADKYSRAEKGKSSKKRSRGQSESDLSDTQYKCDGNRKQQKSVHSEEDDLPALPSASAEKPWLSPHIMVKIVDKQLQGGRLYLKKAEVIEVTQPTRCTLYSRDLRKYVSDVHQNLLETVVPQEEGSRLMVVSGEHKGKRVRLLKRSRDAQVAVVQFMSDLSQVVKLSFDDVSQYVGDKGEEE